MALIVRCPKCGGNIEVSDEVVEEAQKAGVALDVQHENCPVDLGEKVRYRFVIDVYKERVRTNPPEGEDAVVSEKIASVGDTQEAANFMAALPGLNRGINKQWEQIQQMASIADAD